MERADARQQLRARGTAEVRAIGLVLVAAGALALLSIALPHPAGADTGALLATAIPTVLAGLLVFRLGARVPTLAAHALLAAAPVLAGAFTYEATVAAGIYGSILVWSTGVAAYFFSRRVAALHLGWALATNAVTLATVSSSAGFSPVTRWIFTAFSLSLVMLFVSHIVARRELADRRARSFFDLSQDLLCTLDSGGRIVEVNDAWERQLGYAPKELIGRPLVELAHPEDRHRAVEAAVRVFDGDAAATLENRVTAKDGGEHWLRSSAALAPEEGMLYARATDVTELKLVEAEREELVAQLAEMARRDPLTGLPNRRALAEHLPREMARARRGGGLCLALIDVDRFKAFNDRNGHLAGDEMLRASAVGWDQALRAGDLLVRYGGEEFVAILPYTGLDDAAEALERLRAATPGEETCSVGVALWDGVESPEQLIDRADAALYLAKAGGRDCLVTAPPAS